MDRIETGWNVDNGDIDVIALAVEDGIAVVTVDSPPVNALSNRVRAALLKVIEEAEADRSISAIIVTCAGRTFFPGADIAEFGKETGPTLRDLITKIENVDKPVIAAIHGTAFGGGLELAMAMHFRVALASARCGMPEVKLGLLPGAGGTQRLPRLIGVRKALDMILSGNPVDAETALKVGLLDAIIREGQLREGAIAFARRVVEEGRPLLRVRDRDEKLVEGRVDPDMFDASRRNQAVKAAGFKAPESIIRSIEGALSLPFEEARLRERTLFEDLLADPQSKALRYLFFAERCAGKVEDLSPDIDPRPILHVGVVGAGTMGGGISMNFLNAGMPVTIVETSQPALDRGLKIIRRNYEATAAKGRISPADVEQRMSLLTGSTTIADLADCDLVIEAVFEDLDIKRSVFATLDGVAKPCAILATNTSYLDIDAIAEVTSRSHDVIGLHFFSPANVMKLLEIVRTRDTAPVVLATAIQLARTIGKTAVVVGNGFGFVGNRILAARNTQADALLLEGASVTDVDRVLREFGFPMGHFQMRDLVGLDVGWSPERTSSSNVREILNEMGRHGQKSGGGYYDYDQVRRPTDSRVTTDIIADFAEKQGIVRRSIGDEEIRDRMLYAMVNEGAHILGEGVAARASDIDVVWTTGYGWPRYRGGPMFWADMQGLPAVHDRLERLRIRHGEQFAPAPLLSELVAERRSLTERE